MLAIVLKSREQLNIRQRGKKEHIAKMFLIRISLQSNTIILRCYFHQLLIWERTASPRPRWRSANAELRLDLKSVAAPAKHTGEALCAAAKHWRAAAHSSQHASSSIRTWSDTLCLRYMQARLFRRRVKCDTGGQCQAANGRCLPAANVQCINIKNAIQTHQIWSGG